MKSCFACTICTEHKYNKEPCVLLIRDHNGAIFGCYTSERYDFDLKHCDLIYKNQYFLTLNLYLIFTCIRWHIPVTDRQTYGTGESFVFTVYPKRVVYHWSHHNSVFQSSAREFLAIGGGDNFAIYVSGDLSEGTNCCIALRWMRLPPLF